MVYPMPLISELLQDMDKAMWYCSLDGYGKRVLSSGDDGTSKKYFCIHYDVRLVCLIEDAVRVGKCAADLPAPDRQCIVWIFEDLCRPRCLFYEVV